MWGNLLVAGGKTLKTNHLLGCSTKKVTWQWSGDAPFLATLVSVTTPWPVAVSRSGENPPLLAVLEVKYFAACGSRSRPPAVEKTSGRAPRIGPWRARAMWQCNSIRPQASVPLHSANLESKESLPFQQRPRMGRVYFTNSHVKLQNAFRCKSTQSKALSVFGSTILDHNPSSSSHPSFILWVQAIQGFRLQNGAPCLCATSRSLWLTSEGKVCPAINLTASYIRNKSNYPSI